MDFKISKHPSIGELQAPFEFTYADSHRRATWVYMCRGVQELVDYFGKDRKPEDIYRHQVEAYLNLLAAKRGLSQKSVDHYRKAGSAFYTFMAMHQIIPSDLNPFKKLRVPMLTDRVTLIQD